MAKTWSTDEWVKRLVLDAVDLGYVSFSEAGLALEDLENVPELEQVEPILFRTLMDERTRVFMAARGYIGAVRIKKTGAVALISQPIPGAIIEYEAVIINPQLALEEQAETSGVIPPVHGSGFLGEPIVLGVMGLAICGLLVSLVFRGKSKG